MIDGHAFTQVAVIGVGATAVLDAWMLLLQRLGVRTSSFALVGRWVGHLARGRPVHASIADAPPLSGELRLGWLTHYAVGVAFAALLVATQGAGWMQQPTLMAALTVGIGTVVLPLFVMQPAMGLGFAASKTPAPLKNCLRSLLNHLVFGFGLYLAAAGLAFVGR